MNVIIFLCNKQTSVNICLDKIHVYNNFCKFSMINLWHLVSWLFLYLSYVLINMKHEHCEVVSELVSWDLLLPCRVLLCCSVIQYHAKKDFDFKALIYNRGGSSQAKPSHRIVICRIWFVGELIVTVVPLLSSAQLQHVNKIKNNNIPDELLL